MQPDDDFGLAELFGVLYRRKVLFVAIAAACTISGVVIAILMEPVFRATTLLIPADDSSDSGALATASGQYAGLASLVGIDLGSSSNLNTEAIAILSSRTFAESFIQDLNLLPVVFADDWDAGSGQWRHSSPEQIPTVADAAITFTQQVLHISEDRQTGLITLAIEWHDRAMAAEWADTLVTRLNEHMRARAIAEAETSIAYLNRELEKADVVGIRQSIYRLIEAQINKRMLANVREQYALRVVEPAAVPTLRERVRPQRALISIVGAIAGTIFSVITVLLLETVVRIRARAAFIDRPAD